MPRFWQSLTGCSGGRDEWLSHRMLSRYGPTPGYFLRNELHGMMPHSLRAVFAILFLTLLVVLVPAQVQAQEIVEDTLDWRGYYPLEVGNHWEYEIKRGPLNQFSDFQRRVITGDTLIDGTHYFIHEVQHYKLLAEQDSTMELRLAATDYVRYDTARAVLYAIPADSARLHDRTDQAWPGSPFMYDYVRVPRTCELDADFEERFTCESSEGFLIDGVVDGDYTNRPFGPIRVRAWKQFAAASVEVTFGHGLGERFGQIVYARVAGQEYGDSTVTRLDSEFLPDHPSNLSILSLYPSPVRHSFTLRYSLAVAGQGTVEIYDVLGRRVRRIELPFLSPGVHTSDIDVASLPSGVYLLRYTANSSEQVTTPFVVVD